MTSQHTPGPWEVRALPGTNRSMIEPGIAIALGLGRTPAANARLIASAPAMLAALQKALELARGVDALGLSDIRDVLRDGINAAGYRS